jgi:hypothetical protein
MATPPTTAVPARTAPTTRLSRRYQSLESWVCEISRRLPPANHPITAAQTANRCLLRGNYGEANVAGWAAPGTPSSPAAPRSGPCSPSSEPVCSAGACPAASWSATPATLTMYLREQPDQLARADLDLIYQHARRSTTWTAN